jgi:protein-disulfide isomerase
MTTKPAAPPPAASEEDALVPIHADDATWGARLAPVTIVAFEDFQCPFCARGALTLAKVQAKYGPDTVRVVFKHLPLPFHPNARPAAEAAEGVRALAGTLAFWKFYDIAFQNQRDLAPDVLGKWAALAGADPAAFSAGSPAWKAKVDRDLALAEKIGVDGTPTFLINGELLSGAQPLGEFARTVDAELEKAKDAVAKGTPADKVYAVLTDVNLKEAATQAAKAQAEEDKPDPNVYRVPVGKSPVLGDKNAPITIVVFSDFECPYCKEAEKTLSQVREKYGKKVRVVWRNNPLPFHAHAEPAAELALEARAEKGDAGFWAAHDALFTSQPKLDDAALEAVAKDVGLDTAKVKDAIAKHKYEKEIEDDGAVADSFKAEGTPHFFVDGHRLRGAEPLEAFSALIDDDLKKTAGLEAAGTKPVAMYDALVKDGVGPEEPEKRDVAAPPESAPSRGPAKAKVVVQEFADFQCPYCSRAEPAVTRLEKEYGAKVKFVWRNMPLPPSMHPDAQLAAEASLEALAQKGQAGFWKMHDMLFANQGIDGALQRPALDAYAKEMGLDMTRWQAALDGHTHQAEVEADQKAAEAGGITGTPTFVVNGYILTGAQPYAHFRMLVDRALEEASTRAGKARASTPAAKTP